MRAFDIILFLIILQASIVFVGHAGIFNHNYLTNTSLAENQYSTYTVKGNLSGYSDVSQNPSAWDYFKTSITWAVQALIMFVKILFSVLVIYPTLVDVFGIPAPLSALIQVVIVVLWVIGLAQLKSKTSIKHME